MCLCEERRTRSCASEVTKQSSCKNRNKRYKKIASSLRYVGTSYATSLRSSQRHSAATIDFYGRESGNAGAVCARLARRRIAKH